MVFSRLYTTILTITTLNYSLCNISRAHWITYLCIVQIMSKIFIQVSYKYTDVHKMCNLSYFYVLFCKEKDYANILLR